MTTIRAEESNGTQPPAMERREFMAFFAALGLGGTAFPALLWRRAQQQAGPITKEMISACENIAGLEFTDAEREMMVQGLNQTLEGYQALRTVELPNSVFPAISFDPVLPGRELPRESRPFKYTRPSRVELPANLEEVAFWPITKLAELVRRRRVRSIELTEMYLDRLKRHGPTLECVVTLTEDLALEQARRADEEIARGRYRGPLHGIPWGAKDLLAEDCCRTTWGAKPYEDQVIKEDATVVRKLEEAGAVLVAKLSLGALAMGDVWFGGRTRNPWNLEQGSSGSSAGSAAATVAGLVGFSIGSETLGSIVSPSTRCGATGLRPTFGRVSRHGAMALSWTMDKLGPICRSAEDCAIVFHHIHGADGRDPTARTLPFNWDPERKISELRIGIVESAFNSDYETKEFDQRSLEVLRSLGARFVPVELPDQYPVQALRIILNAEAAAAFDDLTRSNRDDLMVRQDAGAWPNTFRRSRFIPAVEYIQANRVRTLLMEAMERTMAGIDVLVAPTFGGNQLLITNLTGHPAVVVPNGFRENGTPTSITFIGKLFGEAEALAVAKAYQDATDFHLRRPPAFT
jgi:Asp-tRNA(Asn)/Glu-tRNA(Gln) amidotransferase A subunit family amidase